MALRRLPPAWRQRAQTTSEGFFKDRQLQTVLLMYIWGVLSVVSLLVMAVIAGAYSLVTRDGTSVVIDVVSGLAWFAGGGVVLQGMRGFIASIVILVVSPTYRNATSGYKVNPLVRWLLTPRDLDLVFQILFAVIIVILELKLGP